MLTCVKNYPRCLYTFTQWYMSNTAWETFYYKLGKPSPFDVSLRDGLQGLSEEMQKEYTFDKKKQIYHDIFFTHRPKNIEIGSIVSNKILPIFSDTIPLLEYINSHQINLSEMYLMNNNFYTNNYILIPNEKNLLKIITNQSIKNFSFITSVSNSFQKKNTNKDLQENEKEISTMMQLLDDCKFRDNKYKVKLYISCINQCPIEGKIDNDYIVNKVLNLYKLNIDEICLSDTCGTLELEDFEYIVDGCNYFGIPFSKMSLHLHVKNNREHIVKDIMHKALDRKIINFDVSLLSSGGCSVTMNKNELSPNLSYELYYKNLVEYIIKKTG